MAIAGRKPKPGALKALHGTARRDRVPRAPKARAAAELRPPPVLRQIAGALAWWSALVGALHPTLRQPAAVPTLSSLAMLLALRDTAARKLRGGGLFVTRDGAVAVSRAFNALTKAAELARKAANDLALSPTELARLGLDAPVRRVDEDDDAPAREDDDLETYLAMHPDRVLQ
jgi:hypothetical protein